MIYKDIEIVYPANRKEWRLWLKNNHSFAKPVWVIFYKKNSKIPTISWSEAVDEALCFGWIDSVKRTIDTEKYEQYFSKRKANSTWSKINKDKVKILIEQGLMTKAGYGIIETAKQNGSWSILDEVEALVIPEDLKKEFNNRVGSLEYFESLSPSAKKILLAWLVLAKRNETRQKRILEIAENASKNLIPKQFR